MSEEKCKFYKKQFLSKYCELFKQPCYGKHCNFIKEFTRLNDLEQRLQTAKEENENLKKLIRKLAIDKIEFDRLKRNETDKVDYSFGQIEILTQQNKQMMEGLNEILKVFADKHSVNGYEHTTLTIVRNVLQALKALEQIGENNGR